MGSGICFGSPTSPPVALVDGVGDEREGGWTRKIAREREMVLGESSGSWPLWGGDAGCLGGVSIRFGKVNYKIALPLFEKKIRFMFFRE